jgi:hypothetical protein
MWGNCNARENLFSRKLLHPFTRLAQRWWWSADWRHVICSWEVAENQVTSQGKSGQALGCTAAQPVQVQTHFTFACNIINSSHLSIGRLQNLTAGKEMRIQIRTQITSAGITLPHSKFRNIQEIFTVRPSLSPGKFRFRYKRWFLHISHYEDHVI